MQIISKILRISGKHDLVKRTFISLSFARSTRKKNRKVKKEPKGKQLTRHRENQKLEDVNLDEKNVRKEEKKILKAPNTKTVVQIYKVLLQTHTDIIYIL